MPPPSGATDAATRTLTASPAGPDAAPSATRAVPDAGAAPAEPPAETDADAEADFRGAITGKNVTAAYHKEYERASPARFSARKKVLLTKYRIILVPGFLTRLYMQLSEVAKDTLQQDGFLDYLSAQREALSETSAGARSEWRTLCAMSAGRFSATHCRISCRNASSSGVKFRSMRACLSGLVVLGCPAF